MFITKAPVKQLPGALVISGSWKSILSSFFSDGHTVPVQVEDL
ncbi:hypothetical protein C7427_11817 [Pantoea ananatis]|nr:hypothetical protein C7427_11817 [Pantoea ananatis]